jgi:uncharacterized protein YjiS (DUF1127 family)
MLIGSLAAARRVLPPSGKSQRVAAFLHTIRRMPQIVWVWFMRVESHRARAMLSDHVLRDIGLTRNDFERGRPTTAPAIGESIAALSYRRRQYPA